MSMRIAVLGGGVMGETLAGGFLRAVEPRPDVVVVEKRAERGDELVRSLGVRIAPALEAVAGADVVVLVVKPQDVPALLADIGAAIEPGSVVISIAAGIRTVDVERGVRAGVEVVRAMPNTPARVGRGVTGISPGAGCSDQALATAVALMTSVGDVVVVPEEQQDAVTAVSGSGPAYVFLLAEAMISAAVEAGLDADTAARMVRGTILGAATLLDAADETPHELRRNVTSPNGTTAAAIAELERLGMPDAVRAAVAAARDRSRELSRGPA